MSASKQPLHVFTVSITCQRQWGDVQQQSLDTVLSWCARMTPEDALRLVDRITAVVNEILPGALAPISNSGAQALEELGKDKQLELGVGCQVPRANNKQ